MIKTVGSRNMIERSRSNDGRAYCTGKVSLTFNPSSPKVSVCGFCGSVFRKRKEGVLSVNLYLVSVRCDVCMYTYVVYVHVNSGGCADEMFRRGVVEMYCE